MGIVATCIGFSLAGTTFMYIVYRTTVMYMFIVLDTTLKTIPEKVCFFWNNGSLILTEFSFIFL